MGLGCPGKVLILVRWESVKASEQRSDNLPSFEQGTPAVGSNCRGMSLVTFLENHLWDGVLYAGLLGEVPMINTCEFGRALALAKGGMELPCSSRRGLSKGDVERGGPSQGSQNEAGDTHTNESLSHPQGGL